MSRGDRITASDSSCLLLADNCWICDAVLSLAPPDGYPDQAREAQVLDLQPHPEGRGMNCVLNDRVHTIGATLTEEALDVWRQEFRERARSVHALNGTIILVDTQAYELVTNQHRAQYGLIVSRFTWTDWSARPPGISFTIGQPQPVMCEPRVHSAFQRYAAASSAPVPAPQASVWSAAAHAATALPGAAMPSTTATATPAAAVPPAAVAPPSVTAPLPPAPTSFLQRLHRYAPPMGCPAFPVTCDGEQSPILHYMTLTRADQAQLDNLLGRQPVCASQGSDKEAHDLGTLHPAAADNSTQACNGAEASIADAVAAAAEAEQIAAATTAAESAVAESAAAGDAAAAAAAEAGGEAEAQAEAAARDVEESMVPLTQTQAASASGAGDEWEESASFLDWMAHAPLSQHPLADMPLTQAGEGGGEGGGEPPFTQAGGGEPPFTQAGEGGGEPPFTQAGEGGGEPPFTQAGGGEPPLTQAGEGSGEGGGELPFTQAGEGGGEPPFTQAGGDQPLLTQANGGEPPFTQAWLLQGSGDSGGSPWAPSEVAPPVPPSKRMRALGCGDFHDGDTGQRACGRCGERCGDVHVELARKLPFASTGPTPDILGVRSFDVVALWQAPVPERELRATSTLSH